MAGKQARAAHAESLGELLSADYRQLLADNQAAEGEPEAESAPESAPAPEPEKDASAASPEPDAQAEIDPATGKQRKVDYGAFHAERERRKASDAKAQKLAEDFAKLSGRIEVLQQIAQPKQDGQPAQVPDINTDPVGHFKALYEQSQQKITDLDRWRQTQEANATVMNNVQQLTRIAQSHEVEFSKKTPDYQDAANYLRNMRDQELQFMGYADPGMRAQILQQDVLQIAAQALSSSMNAAEVVYNIAKARGFTGKAPAKAPDAPAAPSPDIKKLTTVAKGQQANASLGQVNGSAAPTETSVEALLKMSDADFEKATHGENWRKLFA